MKPLVSAAAILEALKTINLPVSTVHSALGISAATFKRYMKKEHVEPMLALSIECLVRREIARRNTAVSPEERAERIFRQREHMAKLKAEAKLKVKATSLPTLEQIEIHERLRAQRLELRKRIRAGMSHTRSEEEMREQELARLKRNEIRRHLKLVHRRNQAREDQRPLIASIHTALKGAFARGDSKIYHDIIRTNLSIIPPSDNFVCEYLDQASRLMLPDDSPFVTLPEETC